MGLHRKITFIEQYAFHSLHTDARLLRTGDWDLCRTVICKVIMKDEFRVDSMKLLAIRAGYGKMEA